MCVCACARPLATWVSAGVSVLVCVGVGMGAKARDCAFANIALLTQNATRRHIFMFPLWLLQCFRHYLINGTIFGKKVTEHKTCVLIFSATFI